MDDKKLEGRLELLKSSYERLPSTIDTEDILKKIEKEKTSELKQPNQEKIKWQRIVVWAVSLASVFIIGILSATLLTDNQTGSEQDDSVLLGDIKEYEKKYAEERLKRQQMLEMDEEEFKELDFVHYADNIFSTQISPGSLEGKNDDITVEEAYQQAIQGLELPSEMIKEVKNGEMMNKKESMEFVEKLITKTNLLIYHYQYTLYNHREFLNAAVFEGKLNKNKLYADREKMPEEIQSMLKVLPKQGLNIEVNDSGTEFLISYNELFFNDYSEKLNYKVVSYIFLQDFILNQNPNNYSMEEAYNLISNLGTMENVLLNTDTSFSIHSNLENLYFNIVESVFFGEYNSVLFDENKKLRQESQRVLSYLTNRYGESPIAAYIRGTLDGIEVNNWKYTFNNKDLNMGQFKELYYQALDGKLDYVELNWEALLAVTQDKTMTSIENSKVVDVFYFYTRFNESFDNKHLYGIGPIEIAILYDYAHDQNNPDMMWELLSDEVKQNFSKESFLEEPVDLIMDGSTILQYDRLKTKVEGSIITTLLGQGDEKLVEANIPMRLDGDNIWRINISLTEK